MSGKTYVHQEVVNTRTHIPCTVGMLAYNSGDTLAQTLESVKDFAEVIIADGGSTDDTLEIAKQYGARVISQTNPGHPITNFARERNLLLDATSQDWFFWIDSDEFISDELREEVRAVTTISKPKHLVYQIPIVRTNPDTLEPYVALRSNYQVRLWSMKTNGRYVKPIHVKFGFDEKQYSIGTLYGAWYVPLFRLDIATYKKAYNKRWRLMVEWGAPKTFGEYLKKGVMNPLVESIKTVARAILVRMLHPFANVEPLTLERNRIYGQWVIACECFKIYWLKL